MIKPHNVKISACHVFATDLRYRLKSSKTDCQLSWLAAQFWSYHLKCMKTGTVTHEKCQKLHLSSREAAKLLQPNDFCDAKAVRSGEQSNTLFLLGAMAPMAPSMMPASAKLANPHRA